MVISKTLEDGIKERNLGKIYGCFYTILYFDPEFVTGKFDETLEIVKSENIPGFMQQYNGKAFKDESDWSQEYWDILASELMDNFCEERIAMLKKVSLKVYPQEKKIDNPNTLNNLQKKTEPIQSEAIRQEPISGKQIAIIMIVIIALILVIVLVK